MKHEGGGIDARTIAGAQQPWIAEIKNKHNTVKSTDRKGTIARLDEQRKTFTRGTRAVFVEVIPKKPIRRFQPVPGYRDTYECDGASFYTLLSFRPKALQEVLLHLNQELGTNPEVISWLMNLRSIPE